MEQGTPMRKSPIVLAGFVVLLIIGLLNYQSIMYGNTKLVTTPTAAPLTGQISQAIAGVSNGVLSLPKPGTDYTLANIKYFSSGTWAYAQVKPVSNNIDSGIVVLKKESGVFVVVLGPGSSFSRTTTLSMPPDVAQYLNLQGLLYGTN